MKTDLARINIFLLCIIGLGLYISYNVFSIGYINHSSYFLKAQANSERISNILARGNIYIQNPGLTGGESDRYLAATNKKFALVQVTPSQLAQVDKDELAGNLALILGLEKEKVLTSLSSGSTTSRVLARRISNEAAQKIKDLGIKGVAVAYEMDRYYPAGTHAADVLGFLGYSEKGRSGQYGIEAAFDSQLFGKSSGSSSAASISGSLAAFKSLKKEKKEEKTLDRPADVVLTIDRNIQNLIEDELDQLLKKWNAQGGNIIVQDPNTGKILAMADRPTFDPNQYSSSDPRAFLNRGVQEMFEPGSSFKPLTMAMGLDLSKVNPETTFTDTGSREIAGYTIKNFSDRVFGLQTMTQILQNSVNTGVMYVTDLVGQDQFLNYVINMGFGQETGIDLPGEVNGDISNLYSGRKINFMTASFGQGIAVTPIQLVNAYSMIANGGKLMRPYVVDRLIKEGGKEEITQPEIVAIPISQKTAARLSSMLVSVVDNGFDKARIPGYDIAGKTGTAQIADGRGEYLENEYIHNFLGFAPASNPRFTILIKIDRPQGITFAADSLSPTFKEISEYLIRYFNIPPTR